MLTITDINTHSTNLEEVEKLKNEFRELLEPAVKEGSLIIISKFPPVGNISGGIDYIVLFMLNKAISKNYLRVEDERSFYVDNFVFLVQKIEDDQIVNINEEYIYSIEGSYNYLESLKDLSIAFEDYLYGFEYVRSFSCFQIHSLDNLSYTNSRILVNHDLSAKYIINSIVKQHIFLKGVQESRITSFKTNVSKNYDCDFLTDLSKKIIDDSNKCTEPGILTKNKIDKIPRNTKIIGEIYDNVGHSISIIKGKAGTGKTMTLSRLLYRFASEKRKVRFLTYNNLLVFDLKQVIRNFEFYRDYKVSVNTLHHFFYKLSKKLGITFILSEGRVNELLEICNLRIEKLRTIFEDNKQDPYKITNEEYLKKELLKLNTAKADHDELKEFIKFLIKSKDLIVFDNIKNEYLNIKKELLIPHKGKSVFIEDYPHILELLYNAITNSEKFYSDLNIKNRYDLLSTLYRISETDEKIIPFELFKKQLKRLKYETNWSQVIIVDEGQDFLPFEKELLFKIKGSENIIVATGGKEQLIRNSTERNWSVTWGKAIRSKIFNLPNGSYRQKQNLINFVNEFSNHFDFNLNLKSIAESKGYGKIVIDTRRKNEIISGDIMLDFRENGKINGCSSFESILLLIPSKGYTSKEVIENLVVNEKDYVYGNRGSINRKVLDLEPLIDLGFICWDGVSEQKNKLKVPHQIETRIIHYESCRGIECWSCACMSLDEYFYFKRSTPEAAMHLEVDLLLSEETRRDKYAALWCLMAFTRPIDTLYIHLENTSSPFSRKILEIGGRTPGTVFL